MLAYSNPSHEADPTALPDLEVFFAPGYPSDEFEEDAVSSNTGAGFYWWSCLPGCLPDSDPVGPFASIELALEDARSGSF